MRVELIEPSGASHTVFDGGDRTAKGGWLEVGLGATTYAVSRVKVWIARGDSTQIEALEAVELDAVSSERYAYNECGRV